MSEERRRILNLLAEGKISADEAECLLDALKRSAEFLGAEGSITETAAKPKYLRVQVNPKQGNQEQVNVRVPLSLIRTGMKLGAMMPGGANARINSALADRGLDVDLGNLKAEEFDALVGALAQTSIEVNDEKGLVRIFCE